MKRVAYAEHRDGNSDSHGRIVPGVPAAVDDFIVERRIHVLEEQRGFIDAGKTLIDCGCGNGATLLKLHERFRWCHGIDVNSVYVRHLQAEALRRRIKQMVDIRDTRRAPAHLAVASRPIFVMAAEANSSASGQGKDLQQERHREAHDARWVQSLRRKIRYRSHGSSHDCTAATPRSHDALPNRNDEDRDFGHRDHGCCRKK
ncbi:MAG: hypothetical protein ACREHD_09845 [Pirellulales bacterium]